MDRHADTTGATAAGAPATGATAVGIVADGGFKVLLGAAFVLGAAPLSRPLGVPLWLLVVSGAALLAGGAAELRYARVRPARAYVRLMIGYDTGWALVTLAGVLMAVRGGTAGGEVWIGYQAVTPLLFAALLASAAPARLTPSAAS
ncbi:hypothetical protein ACFQ67_05170 [Streptomyces sp. NPDC056488]|uniref:hypothetical protein n=1 Tax=unclassified Streptomyces TaxID=2593676 RepID=UPI0036757798